MRIIQILILAMVMMGLTACQEDREINATEKTIQGTWYAGCEEADDPIPTLLWTQESLAFNDDQYRLSIDVYQDSNCITPATDIVTNEPDKNLFGDYALYTNKAASVVTPSGLTAHQILFEEQGQERSLTNLIAVVGGVLYLGDSLIDRIGQTAYPDDLQIDRGFRQ